MELENEYIVVAEFILASGATSPAILATHQHTATLLKVLFRLFEEVPKAENKEILLEHMCSIYKQILDNPVGATA